MRSIGIWLLGSVLALAQGTDASLSGTVGDPSGRVVPAAVVAAENLRTGVAHRTRSNESGIYLFPALPPGLYQVSAERPGFRKLVYDQVLLEVGDRLSLNLDLEVGAVTESVEVKADQATALATVSSSVGSVVAGQKLMDLPLPDRNVMGLVGLQAGVVGANINGARRGNLNITLDGINIQDNSINFGVASPIFTSVDNIEEFRVITSPADAEYGRGSGQIQMLTRSGTNQFHGSLFESHRNTLLNANAWFNNQRGHDRLTGEPISPRNILIRNQFGGRLGGPIRRNRTFFHFLFDGQRQRTRNAQTLPVFTATGRAGLFRFFPGARNGNASAAVPTVDLQGNPQRPASAAGPLQEVNVFGRDPNRTGPDRSGNVRKMLDLMPLPNNFRIGDGLNTAGFTWQLPASADRDQINLRVDHTFSSAHRLSLSYTREKEFFFNGFLPQPFPQSPGGNQEQGDSVSSLAVTSTLRPNLLNEFRAGVLRPRYRRLAPWEVAGSGLLPRAGDQAYLLNLGIVTNPLDTSNDPQGRTVPVYQFSDTVTWLKGAHAFKAGGEARFTTSNGFVAFGTVPEVNLGPGSSPVQNVGSIPGIGQNQGPAEGILNALAGSVSSVVQGFNSPGGANPAFLAGETLQRTWRQREFSFFFKDDIKVTPKLTLNLGVRYEWYGVPWEANGKTQSLAGGSGGIFGMSGSSFGDLYQPGRTAGSLTRIITVGPRSQNPERQLYGNDNNNLAPGVGLAWSLPSFTRLLGKDRTIFRMGYGIAYERPVLATAVAGAQPGLQQQRTLFQSGYQDLTGVRLPLQPLGRPLDVAPLTDRTQLVYGFDDNLRVPYVQNWNAGLQQQLGAHVLLDVRYVGSKGTRLMRTADVNEVNIFENGILEAFRVTQAGGNAPLLDRIFMGLAIPGLGTVDGIRITGSDAARALSSTQGQLAVNSVGGFATYLNTTTELTGARGGLPRRAGLPENWITGNPQYNGARLVSNFASSTYHSLQVEATRRFAAGWSFQTNYTWSRTLGEEEGDGQRLEGNYRNLRNRRQDKRLLGSHRTHFIRASSTWELPLGPGKRFAGSSRGVMARLLERWQISTGWTIASGFPMDLTSGAATFNQFGNNTPTALAAFPKSAGSVTKVGDGVIYFDGYRQAPDPSLAGLTTALRTRSTLQAITDSSGRLLLVNPAPGLLGSVGSRLLEGPGTLEIDLNLLKRIQVREHWNLELRADAISVTNSPQFLGPDTGINSTTFGRITAAGGNRIVVVGLRFNF